MQPASGQCAPSTPILGPAHEPTAVPEVTSHPSLLNQSPSADSELKLFTKKQKQIIDTALQLEDTEMGKALLEIFHYRSVTQRYRLDLIEGCAPIDSPLTDTVLRPGGKAARFGLHNADLSNDTKFSWARKCAAMKKPRHMWSSPPCAIFSKMQNANPWHKKT